MLPDKNYNRRIKPPWYVQVILAFYGFLWLNMIFIVGLNSLRLVSSRHRELMQFARNHDVIVFVSGKESSNGKVLYELCRSVNPRTYHIVSPEGLDPGWFDSADSAGVCGATSTPWACPTSRSWRSAGRLTPRCCIWPARRC